jgi:hypothetical protein
MPVSSGYRRYRGAGTMEQMSVPTKDLECLIDAVYVKTIFSHFQPKSRPKVLYSPLDDLLTSYTKLAPRLRQEARPHVGQQKSLGCRSILIMETACLREHNIGQPCRRLDWGWGRIRHPGEDRLPILSRSRIKLMACDTSQQHERQ